MRIPNVLYRFYRWATDLNNALADNELFPVALLACCLALLAFGWGLM